jgi:hypothetical protein
VREDFCFLSENRAFNAASQSNTEWTDLALKGERRVLALSGESMLEMAGLGGSFRLGNEAAPGGADIGADVGNGLGGTTGAVVGGDALLLTVEVGEDCPVLDDRSAPSDSGLLFAEPGLESPDVTDGEFNERAFDKKSVYADGGLMGVLIKSGSGLK